MNLSQDTLRWLTVKALQNRTWAGPRVYDSPGEPANLRMDTERAPFIAVYTDDADFDLDTEGVGVASLYDPGGTVYLVVEVSVAGQAESSELLNDPDPDKADDPDIVRAIPDRNTIAATDAGLEARIGFMARQVCDALAAPDNPWAELWRRLAHARTKVEVRRGGSGLEADQSAAIRFASRVMRFSIGVLAEPVPGDCLGPGSFWTDFLDRADADEDLKGVATIIRDHIEGVPQEEWLVAQRGMMLTDAGIRGIGIGPAILESRETPLLKTVDRVWSPNDE